MQCPQDECLQAGGGADRLNELPTVYYYAYKNLMLCTLHISSAFAPSGVGLMCGLVVQAF